MKIAIKTTRSRDVNGNTTYTAIHKGKRFKQQKIITVDDVSNHLSALNQLANKLHFDHVFNGAYFDDKTMFFISED